MRVTYSTTRPVGMAAALTTLAILAGVAMSARADPALQVPGASSIVGDAALSQTHGAILVNQAAGSGNAQQNSGALAIGPSAVAALGSYQQVDVRNLQERMSATTQIRAQAFNDARGWIAVNQTAGQGNAQSNGLAIVMGGDAVALTDVQLARVDVLPQQGTGVAGDRNHEPRTTEIAGTAFSGVRGVVQVNQSAGRGNVTANRVRLRIEGVVSP